MRVITICIWPQVHCQHAIPGWNLTFVSHIIFTHNVYLFFSSFISPLFFVICKIRLHQCLLDILIFVGGIIIFQVYITCQYVEVNLESIARYFYLFFTPSCLTSDLPHIFTIQVLFHIEGDFLKYSTFLHIQYCKQDTYIELISQIQHK